MTERLIIRLASEASQKQHWLIWSDRENEIIASGEIDNAEQLKLLTEKAQSRSVICLLPGVEVCIKEVVIKGAFNRQMQQALPYLIEEDLAGDVDKLHFTVVAKETDLVHVAVCDKQRMYNWLGWLADAGIVCRQFIPEGLTLPFPADRNWQAVQIDNHWLVRESKYMAWGCELSMLNAILQTKLDEQSSQIIESYSPILEAHRGVWTNDLPTLPMELLCAGAKNCKVNLLHSEFKVKKAVNQNLLQWRLPAIIAALFFVIALLNISLKTNNVDQQIVVAQGQVETVYALAFPAQAKLKYSRVKKKMKSMLGEIAGGDSAAGFLVMLDELAPIFSGIPQITATSVKYDDKKQEVRVLAVADNFQAFEKFAAALPKQYLLEQGALNSSKQGVSGLLTIRKR